MPVILEAYKKWKKSLEQCEIDLSTIKLHKDKHVKGLIWAGVNFIEKHKKFIKPQQKE